MIKVSGNCNRHKLVPRLNSFPFLLLLIFFDAGDNFDDDDDFEDDDDDDTNSDDDQLECYKLKSCSDLLGGGLLVI